MAKIFTLLLCFIAALAPAQNLTGVWRGSFGQDFFGDIATGDMYRFEVQIDQRQTEVRGITYSYHNTDFYAKASLTGKWEKANKKFTLIEGSIIEVRKMSTTFVCSMTCSFTYSKVGDQEYLIGTYKSVSEEDGSYCGGGKVRLKRMAESVFRKEPFLVKREAEIKARKAELAKNKPKTNNNTITTAKNGNTKTPVKTNPTNPVKTPPKNNNGNNTTTVKVPTDNPVKNTDDPPKVVTKTEEAPPAVVRDRNNDVQQTIPLDDEEVTVNLYDNGEIDGDIISIYLNGKNILSKKTLTYDPLTITLKKSELNNVNELVMVAENMGSLPPNTASMIVYVGKKRYEVRMESSDKKNAAVRFEK